MKEFQKGQRIKTASGSELEVLEKLGEGGQGIVYRVNYNGRQLALKWYFGNKLSNADKFYRNIQNNIKQGAPTTSFLWPLEITEYLMPLLVSLTVLGNYIVVDSVIRTLMTVTSSSILRQVMY